MPKFEKGNQWSRNGKERPTAWLAVPSCASGSWKILFADWQEGGQAAIKMMRIERPAEYVRVMCSILPKEMLFETGSVSELADDELDQMITMLRERALAARQEQALELEKAPEPKLLNGRHYHDKREAELLARLEAERETRIAEKIAAGEIVSVPLFIVAGVRTSGPRPGRGMPRPTSWQSCALRAISEKWCSTSMLVDHRRVQPGEIADPASVPTAPAFSSPEDCRRLAPATRRRSRRNRDDNHDGR